MLSQKESDMLDWAHGYHLQVHQAADPHHQRRRQVKALQSVKARAVPAVAPRAL